MKLEDIENKLTEIEDGLIRNGEELKADGHLTLQKTRAYLDRFDGVKDKLLPIRRALAKELFETRKAHEDEFRKFVTKPDIQSRNYGSWEERKNYFETKALDTLHKLKTLERIKERVDLTLEFVKQKEHWLGERRFDLKHEERMLHTVAKSEYDN